MQHAECSSMQLPSSVREPFEHVATCNSLSPLAVGRCLPRVAPVGRCLPEGGFGPLPAHRRSPILAWLGP
eukprot:12865353-Alexandrium_andersonii.AAC.1